MSCPSATSAWRWATSTTPTSRTWPRAWNGTSWSVEPSSNPAGGDQQLTELGVVQLAQLMHRGGLPVPPLRAEPGRDLERHQLVGGALVEPGRGDQQLTGCRVVSVGHLMHRGGLPVPPLRAEPGRDLERQLTPPSVTNVSPNSGPAAGGTAVTITGAGFPAPAPSSSDRGRDQRDRQQRDPDHCV